MKSVWIGIAVIIVTLTMSSTASAAFTQSGDATTVSQSVNDDAYVAGNDVTITAPIHGELFGAGNTVTVTDSTDRSIFAAGNTVTIKRGAGYNAFVVGSTVTLSGEYGHDLFVAGNAVIVEPGTVIRGTLYAAGKSVVLHGSVLGDVRFAGTTLTTDAVIKGSIIGTMETLSFSGGSVGGDLRYESNATATALSTVSIHGTTVRTSPQVSTDKTANSFPNPSVLIMQFLGLMLAGAVLILLMPKKVEVIADTMVASWIKQLGVGVVALLLGPIIAGFAFMTVVGWPIGLVILALWAIELYFAGALGTIFLGRLITRTKPTSWWISLAAGALAITIGTNLPFVGMALLIGVFFGLTLPAFGASLAWWKTNTNHH